MTATCDKMLITLINKTVKLDDEIQTNPSNEELTIQKYMKGPMMDFLRKCGDPLTDCRKCNNIFPYGRLSKLSPKSTQEKKSMGGLRLMRIDGNPIPWGTKIDVEGYSGLPSIKYTIPSQLEYVRMSPGQKNSVREGIRRAMQIQAASNRNQTLYEFRGYQMKARADLRRQKRAEKEKKAQRKRERQALSEGRVQTMEEKIGWLTGVKPKAPPEPPTSEKGPFAARSGKFEGLPEPRFSDSLLPTKEAERLYADLFNKKKRK
jgi:hypothetical protein